MTILQRRGDAKGRLWRVVRDSRVLCQVGRWTEERAVGVHGGDVIVVDHVHQELAGEPQEGTPLFTAGKEGLYWTDGAVFRRSVATFCVIMSAQLIRSRNWKGKGERGKRENGRRECLI